MIELMRGEIWMVNLNPTKGHEQSGIRPGLIISDDIFNSGPADLVVILPLTTKNKKIPLHKKIAPPVRRARGKQLCKMRRYQICIKTETCE